MRGRIVVAVVLVGGLLLGLFVPPVSAVAPSDREEVAMRFAWVESLPGESRVTPNGKWDHFDGATVFLAGSGTIGDTHYVGDAVGDFRGKVSPDSTAGRVTADMVYTFSPEVGATLTCVGFAVVDHYPEPAPFGEEGFYRLSCDDGSKMKGSMSGQWEYDSATGWWVFVYTVTGTAR